MKNTFYLKKVGNLDVFFRNPDASLQAANQPKELERAIKLLTNEDFEDYYDEEEKKNKQKLKNPENFKIIFKYEEDKNDKYICLCSEDTCSYLVIVKHIPTNIYIALGSICYKRFDEKNGAEVYYHCDAKRCKDCNTPLVFKLSKFKKNTNKHCNGRCFDCVEKRKEEEIKSVIEQTRVYLNVSYDNKDDAKLLGAKWNPEKKKWYALNNSAEYTALIEKYS